MNSLLFLVLSFVFYLYPVGLLLCAIVLHRRAKGLLVQVMALAMLGSVVIRFFSFKLNTNEELESWEKMPTLRLYELGFAGLQVLFGVGLVYFIWSAPRLKTALANSIPKVGA